MAAFPTSTTVLDSILYRDAFGTPRMREIFSDHALICRYAEVEVALAKAEARCDVIPVEAAEEIARRTDVAAFDFDRLRRETEIVGYAILPLVQQIVKQCGDAGRYVHWGATTQDIMDTRPSSSRSGPASRSSRRISRRFAPFSPICRSAIAIHRWQGAPIFSRHCR